MSAALIFYDKAMFIYQIKAIRKNTVFLIGKKPCRITFFFQRFAVIIHKH